MLWVNSHQACTHDRAATSHVLQLRRSMLCRSLPFRNMQLRHRIVPQAVSSNSARLTSAQWDFSQSISPTHNSRRNSIAECRPLQPEISPTVNSADGLDSFISSAIGFNNGDSSRRSCASTTSIAHDSQRRAGRLCCGITSLPPGLNGTFGSDSSERDNRSPATHVLDAAPLSRPAEVILNGNPSVEDLASALARLPRRVSSATVLEGATVSVAQMSSIMTELARMKRPERALSTFIWFEQSPRHALNDCRPYTRIVSLLSRHREHTGDALGIVDRMFDLHIKPDLVCFNTAIDAAGKASQPGRARRLYEQLLQAGFQPNVNTFTSLIAGCQKTGHWQDALAYMDMMRAKGVSPNVRTYTTLMSACTRAGQWQRALEAFTAMEREGILPDVAAFNSGISAYAAVGAWDRAWAIFGEMKRAGFQPNIRSFNALMSACERSEEPDRAIEVFRKIERAHETPTAVTYNTLLSALGKAGRYDETIIYFEQMRKAGLKADAFTLTALLTACERVGKWQEAVQFDADFRAAGVATNLRHHNCLISVFSTAEQWQLALRKLRYLQDRGWRPDAVSFSCTIVACQRGGESELALQLFDEMLQAKLVPKGYLFATLISACERNGDWERAIGLYDTMKEMQIDAPSVAMAARSITYNWPWLIQLMPPALVVAGHATVESGRAARRWLRRNDVASL